MTASRPRVDPADQPTVIFLHIGKTAGLSLRQVLRRQVPSSRVLEFRAPLPEPGRLRREGALAHLAGLPERDRARARLVMGHAPFGVHELIPRPSTYVTMLRDPVALVLSVYRYILRTERHILHEEVVRRDLSLDAFVRSGLSLETDNSQTRAVAGDTSTPFGGCGSEMLERAKTNIEERFSVVGLTERFDESLLLLRRAFGWRNVRYVSTNVAPDHGRSRPPPETVELIRERNRLDLELYAWAARRFDARIAEVPGFDRDLRRFRLANRLYRPWGHVTYTIPRRAAARVGR
jgi:hypothetical protein